MSSRRAGHAAVRVSAPRTTGRTCLRMLGLSVSVPPFTDCLFADCQFPLPLCSRSPTPRCRLPHSPCLCGTSTTHDFLSCAPLNFHCCVIACSLHTARMVHAAAQTRHRSTATSCSSHFWRRSSVLARGTGSDSEVRDACFHNQGTSEW